MSAANTDNFLKAVRKRAGNLDSSGIANGTVDNFGLDSASGLPTDTAITVVIDRVDANGNKTPDKEEEIIGVVSGDRLINCVRGVSGTAQAHSAGAVWEVRLTAAQWNRIIAGILVEHGQDGKHGAAFHALTEKTTPDDEDEISLTDSAASWVLKKLTWENLKATLKTYLDTLYPPKNGWISYTSVTPTRASADDPTYVLTFAGVDLTSFLGVGMRVKWTQNSTVRYGIITNKDFSTNTTLTIYGGTDYDVDDTASQPISGFCYSQQKAPFGFPLDQSKWMVEISNKTESSQASPAQDTWYNLGSVGISVPIGAWLVQYETSVVATGLTSPSIMTTLSTNNSSETDDYFTAQQYITGSTELLTTLKRSKFLSLAAKTTYYLLHKVTNTGGAGTLRVNMSIGSDNLRTVIRAVCAYL